MSLVRNALDERLLQRVERQWLRARDLGRCRSNSLNPGRPGAEGVHATLGREEPVNAEIANGMKRGRIVLAMGCVLADAQWRCWPAAEPGR